MEILENYNSLSKEQKEMLMDSSKEKIKEKIDEVFLPLEKRLEIAKKFTNDYHKSFKKTLPEMEAYTDISRSFFEKIIDTSLSLLKVCIPVFIGLISIRESTAFTNFVDINVARKSLCVLLVAIFTIGILFPFLGYRKIIRRLDKVLSVRFPSVVYKIVSSN